jgi:hypothetical protein
LPTTFNGSSGALSASAKFDTSGTDLVITLTNTAAGDVVRPTDILTGVFFDLAGNPALSRTSVVLAPGSKVYKNNVDLTPGSGIISGEYCYLGGGPTLMWGAEQGVSAVGYGVFGPANRFPGGNVADHGNPPGGLDFGLSSAGDNPATHNGGANRALVRNSVIFTLGGLPAGFNPIVDVTNVTFQYGTAMDEPHITVPEPASAGLLITAGAMLLLRRRRSLP